MQIPINVKEDPKVLARQIKEELSKEIEFALERLRSVGNQARQGVDAYFKGRETLADDAENGLFTATAVVVSHVKVSNYAAPNACVHFDMRTANGAQLEAPQSVEVPTGNYRVVTFFIPTEKENGK